MSETSEKDRRDAFKALHQPDRPIYQIGHARRTNSAEVYDSKAISDAADRLLERSMKAARGVIDNFAKNAKKS